MSASVLDLDPSAGLMTAQPDALEFRSVTNTHQGCIRNLNEDACLDRSDIGLWAVADGMGGHDAGNLASTTVIQALSQVSAFGSAFAFRRAVRSALLDANRDLQRKADDELLDVIGSTVVTLLVHHQYFACIWAGDSRGYLLRQGKLERITRDHSVVQEMIDAGELPPAAAEAHARSHVVTRAVGAAPRLDLEGAYGRIEAGDRFLLCSDGLGIVPDAEIARYLRLPSLGGLSSSLMQRCLDLGAPDNVSFVVVEAITPEAA